MDCVGVDAALLQAREIFCRSAISLYPDRFAACEIVDPSRPDLDEFVAAYRDHAGMLALRVLLRSWTDGALSEDFVSGRYERLFAAAERYAVPLFVVAAGHLSKLVPVIAAHPNLTLILDHLGLNQPPALVGDDPWADVPNVTQLAQIPNVHVKFTGAITLARTPYPFQDVWPPLSKIIDAFGPQRLMWGSDMTRIRFAPRSTERGPRAILVRHLQRRHKLLPRYAGGLTIRQGANVRGDDSPRAPLAKRRPSKGDTPGCGRRSRRASFRWGAAGRSRGRQ